MINQNNANDKMIIIVDKNIKFVLNLRKEMRLNNLIHRATLIFSSKKL